MIELTMNILLLSREQFKICSSAGSFSLDWCPDPLEARVARYVQQDDVLLFPWWPCCNNTGQSIEILWNHFVPESETKDFLPSSSLQNSALYTSLLQARSRSSQWWKQPGKLPRPSEVSSERLDWLLVASYLPKYTWLLSTRFLSWRQHQHWDN